MGGRHDYANSMGNSISNENTLHYYHQPSLLNLFFCYKGSCFI